MDITRDIRYNGTVVATVKSVRTVGVNVEVTFTNGYVVVVPPSQVSAEVLALI